MKKHTDLKQSKYLYNIGIDPNTADMCWGLDAESLQYNNVPYLLPWKDYTTKNVYIPVWSLTALLTLIPHVDLAIYDDGTWICSSFDDANHFKDDATGDNPIDAAYELLVKLNTNIY